MQIQIQFKRVFMIMHTAAILRLSRRHCHKQMVSGNPPEKCVS